MTHYPARRTTVLGWVLVALTIVAAMAAVAPEARAQGPAADLRLVSQNAWASPKQPFLRLAVAITSDTDLPDAVLRVSVLEPLLSRSELRTAMEADTGAALSTTTYPLDGLAADVPAQRSERVRVAFLDNVSDEARVYPVRVEVAESADGPALATMRSALIFLPATPKEPLNLAWTFVLGHPIDFGPNGVFLGRSLERRLAPGGSLSGAIGSLDGMLSSADRSPVDVVVSPTLLENLGRMQDGYRVLTGEGLEEVAAGDAGATNARATLDHLRTIASAPSVELSAMPFAVPDLPQLVASGFADDIPEQLNRGRAAISAALAQGTGSPVGAIASPNPAILRPPGSSIDEATLRILRKEGVGTLLLDERVVEQPPQPNDFAPPATAELAPGLDAVVPDDDLQALIASPLAHDDPHLLAQWALADLASIWLEQPDLPRATALMVSGEQDLSPDFFQPLVRGVAAAPWLRPTKATGLLDRFPPSEPPERVRLRPGDPMPADYAAAIVEDRDLIAELRSILVDPDATPLPAVLESDLLLTQGSSLVDRENLGQAWLESIRDRVVERFDALRVDTAQVVTLTSSGGRIPVRVTNSGDLDVRVRIELRSSRLRFPTGSSRIRTLAPGQTAVLVFDAAARTTGTFPVQVAIETPSGAVLAEDKVVVRSTAYNLVALLITLGAMLVLLIIWGRRHLSLKRR